MVCVEGNCRIVVLVCESCHVVGHVGCWLCSHVIVSGSISLGCPTTSSRTPLRSIMASSSSANFQSIFNASLQAYDNKTKNNLLNHPLATQLQSCDSPHAVLAVLQDLVQKFDQRRTSDGRLKNWLDPTVNVLCTFSATLGGGVALVSLARYRSKICALIVIYQAFHPGNVILAGIGVLLQVSALADLSMQAIMTPAFLRPQRM